MPPLLAKAASPEMPSPPSKRGASPRSGSARRAPSPRSGSASKKTGTNKAPDDDDALKAATLALQNASSASDSSDPASAAALLDRFTGIKALLETVECSESTAKACALLLSACTTMLQEESAPVVPAKPTVNARDEGPALWGDDEPATPKVYARLLAATMSDKDEGLMGLTKPLFSLVDIDKRGTISLTAVVRFVQALGEPKLKAKAKVLAQGDGVVTFVQGSGEVVPGQGLVKLSVKGEGAPFGER